jgi:23S rRNA pseudouridine1911/1915/1917 synthase
MRRWGDIVKRYVKIHYNKAGEVFLGVVHRIDRPVSGAGQYARTKALQRLNEMFQKRERQETILRHRTEPPT